MNNTLQLTIRGIDSETKEALTKKAKQQGLSLNRYALKALQQGAGVEDSERRYLEIKKFLKKHSIEQEDYNSINEALLWSDETSLQKQG